MATEYIVDTSVLIQAFVADTESARARTLIHTAFESPPSVLHIPEFCLLECGNIIWKRVLFHALPLIDANRTLESLRKTPLTVHLASDFLPRALEIAVQHRLAVYDSIYLAMVEKLRYPFITVDTQQATAAQNLGVVIKPLSDFPQYKI